ncbi:unnamed protein product [Sympodiomycopsis kandeliae]
MKLLHVFVTLVSMITVTYGLDIHGIKMDPANSARSEHPDQEVTSVCCRYQQTSTCQRFSNACPAQWSAASCC